MKILITDDHPLVRNGLSIIVNEGYPSDEIFEAGNGEQAVAVLKKQPIDLMLMDIRMPDTDSLLLVQQALKIRPDVKILVVSMNPEHVFALRYLKMGASGYFEKNGSSTLLLSAIKTVLSGKTYLSNNITDQLAQSLITGDKKENPFESLTNREFEMVNHLSIGLKPSQICELMSLRPSSVTTYKKKIYEKLGIKNDHDLYALAKNHNF